MRYLFLSLLLVSLLSSCSKDDEQSPNQAPSTFKLLTVANNANGVVLQPTLNWEEAIDPDGDAVTYELYLDKNAKPTTSIKTGLTSAAFKLTTPLAANTNYYWIVVASDTKGAKTESSVFKFTTQSAGASNQAPAAFNLTAPANNAANVALTPTLGWQAATDPDGDAVTYSVYLDQNANPSTAIKSGLTTTNFTLTTALANNTAYYWKVVATDAKGATTASSVYKFTTLAATPATVSLPVKITYKNAGGTAFRTATMTYDSQKRLNKKIIVDQVNPGVNNTQTLSYDNGKITLLLNYDNNPSSPKEKHIYYYNANGMQKEELYYDNVLSWIHEWFYRTDGGKERKIKRASNELYATWYYRFSSTGNIQRAVLDNVHTATEDEEYTFGNYDNKLSSGLPSEYTYVLPYIIMGFPGTNLPTPNNPQVYTKKSLTTGNVINNYTIEYTYNAKNQVTLMKLKNVSNGALIQTRTIEYQEF